MRAHRIALVLCSTWLAACAARRGLDVERQAAPPPDPSGLTVTLEWQAPVDLDLYVTDPAWVTHYYAHRKDVMGPDARCEDGAPSAGFERAHFAAPRPGRYRVGVDFPEACSGDPRGVPFRIVVDHDGKRRAVSSGSAELRIRNPAAMEFTIP
jgi:hypothetical protein